MLVYILVMSENVIKYLMISWWDRPFIFKNEAITNCCKFYFYGSNLSIGRVTWFRIFYWKTSNFQCWTSFSLGLFNIPERNGLISCLGGICLCSWSQAGMKGLTWSWTWCTILSDACFLYTQSPSTLISPGYNLENNPWVFCRYEKGAITTLHK